MPDFQLQTYLPVDSHHLAQASLNMPGVNNELWPIIKMSAPNKWQALDIRHWPINRELFYSTVYLLGVIPMDRHHFKFNAIHDYGFTEVSTSLVNALWSHERLIKNTKSGAVIDDRVLYTCKFSFMGWLLLPIYKGIFKYRHYRLKRLFGSLPSVLL